MWEALLAIRHHGCPVSDTSANHPDVHLENISKMRTSKGHAKRLLCLHGDKKDINSFANEFRSHGLVRAFDRVSEQPEKRIAYFSSEIQYQENNSSILSILDQSGCYQHSTVHIKRGIEHWVIYTKNKRNVNKVVRSLKDQNNHVNLDREVDIGRVSNGDSIEFTTILTTLTPRQRAAFETALDIGYYTDKSEVTMDAIAQELDVHQSTVWEHVKKAENKILRDVGSRVFEIS